jgi:hypothetical protein
MRSKRFVYTFATVTTVAIFFLFRDHVWALYLSACTGFTVLVFGRRLEQRRRLGETFKSCFAGGILLTHATYLAIVVGWVWFLIAIAPHVPYILRTEDSNRPYFGLAFIGILGLLFLELVEQRNLRPRSDPGESNAQIAVVRRENAQIAK